jgi:hypothetical protein
MRRKGKITQTFFMLMDFESHQHNLSDNLIVLK